MRPHVVFSPHSAPFSGTLQAIPGSRTLGFKALGPTGVEGGKQVGRWGEAAGGGVRDKAKRVSGVGGVTCVSFCHSLCVSLCVYVYAPPTAGCHVP